MEKYITTEQIKTIVDNAPKGVDKAKLVDTISNKGYIIQGFNDQEYQKQKSQKSYFERFASDVTGRMQDVAKPVQTAIETAKDTNISPTQRVLGTIAEVGKVPLRAAGATYGVASDLVGQAINTATGDTELKTLEQQRSENPVYSGVESAIGSEGARTVADITNTLGGEAIGAILKPASKLLSSVASNVASKVGPDAIKTSLGHYAEESVKKEASNILKSTRSITKAVDLLKKKGTDLESVISDPTIFRGIKIVDKKIDPTEAISTLDERITQLVDAKKEMLPEIDRLIPKQSKEVIRSRAYKNIAGKYTEADEKVLKASIDKQIDALPNELSVSDIDVFRAKARASARNAKGLQKSSNEYAALENSARDTVFDLTDSLPVANSQEFKALNDTIKQWIEAKDFLENTLKGQVAKGGRLQEYVARGIGALAGAQNGPLGSIIGSEIGGTVSNIIVNNQLGSSMKMRLIRNITNDPVILKKAEGLLNDVKVAELLRLPSPSGKVGATGKEVIESLSSRKDRSIGFPDQK